MIWVRVPAGSSSFCCGTELGTCALFFENYYSVLEADYVTVSVLSTGLQLEIPSYALRSCARHNLQE